MSKKLRILIGGIFIASFLFCNSASAYDNNSVHPALTRATVDFYELSTGKKLTDNQKNWMMLGSIEEDKVPRWLNHFYDPVFKRGLSTEVAGVNGYPADKWGQFSSYQTLHPENISNLWTGNGPVISGSWWGDFSYEAAVNDYSKNDEKGAYIALGHILHLMQDLTVPEHTRNDAHPGSNLPSYYENWTAQNSAGLTQDLGKKLFVKGDKPVDYADLASYFDNLAAYTNGHFFSPRTINSEIYSNPKIVYEDGVFAYGKDENGQLFDLAIAIKDFSTKKVIYDLNSNQILQEYWFRLSRQAVVNGAGVIGLFINQGELAKQKAENQPKSSLISQVADFFTGGKAPSDQPVVSFTNGSLENGAPQINRPAPASSNTASAPAAVKTPAAPKTTQKPAVPRQSATSPSNPAPAKISPNESAVKNNNAAANPPVANTDTGAGNSGSSRNSGNSVGNNGNNGNSGGSAARNNAGATGGGGGGTSAAPASNPAPTIASFNTGDLVINEIMYNPEGADDKREWLELYNNSGGAITLSGGNGGWRFNDGSNHLLNEPAARGSMTIPAGGYAVLADDAPTFLTEHNAFSGILIDTTMSLKNTSATLKISDPSDNEIDSATYDKSWGGNGDGRTLSRKSVSGGSSDANNWSASAGLGGTPGAVNDFLGLENSTTTAAIATSTPEIATTTIDIATSTPSVATSTIDIATTTPEIAVSGTDIAATTTIAENTTWTLAGSPYRLFYDTFKHPTVAAGAALTIEPGVKVIPQSGDATALEIKGSLNAVATSGAPIIFTSPADTDGAAASSPRQGDWRNIVFSAGSTGNFDYAEFRYGGGPNLLAPFHEMIEADGATMNINHSKFENSQNVALHLKDSSGTIQNSIFSDNNCGISVDSAIGVANVIYGNCYGVHTTGQTMTSAGVSIKNNTFVRNRLAGIETRSGAAPVIDGNTFTDNGAPITIESSYPLISGSQIANTAAAPAGAVNGIIISDYTHFSQDLTIKKDLAYVLKASGGHSPTVDAGVALTIEPGAIFKIGHTFPALYVNGSLIASTTAAEPIVFTSLKDDSRGGDTNGDGSASVPQDNDWARIKFSNGSAGNFSNAVFSYGGFGAPAPITSKLVKDFPAAQQEPFEQDHFYIPSISSDYFVPDHSGVFDHVVIHNFHFTNPGNHQLKFGIFDIDGAGGNSTPAGGFWTMGNQQNINGDYSANVPDSRKFDSGHRYNFLIACVGSCQEFSYFQINTNPTTAAGAFYEYVAPLPAALSIDAGASVVVQ